MAPLFLSMFEEAIMSGASLSHRVLIVGVLALSVFTILGCGGPSTTNVAATPLPSPVSGSPVAVSVTPNSGTGNRAVFQAVFSDPNGTNRITADIMINHVAGWAGACGVRYDRATNGLFLINDAGNGWLGPITPGAAATLQNVRCILNGATSSAVGSGDGMVVQFLLSVNFDVTFLPGFVGEKNIYLYAHNAENNSNSGLMLLGTWSLSVPQSFISVLAGKNPEGMAVNPVTHKAYIVGEVDNPDRQVVMVFDDAALAGTSAPKLIEIPDETEYITVDSTRNRIYLSTRYGLDNEEGGGGDVGDSDAPTSAQATGVTLGTLTVIDGNTDTVIATYQFQEGVEPEGVAVDTVENVVYVGTKAPEPEPFNGACPSGTFFIDEDGDEECWTAGNIVAFNADNITAGPIKTIPAGDDPESIVFANNMIYAANEDDGTVTIATAVKANGSGGELITDPPAYSANNPRYSLGIFFNMGPNTLACPDKRYEADKMAAGGNSVFITDDKSRVGQIRGAAVFNSTAIPIDPVLGQCDLAKGNDENGLNTANNIAFMQPSSTKSPSAVYVVSEQDTVAILDPETLALRTTITIPGAVHLDAVAVDGAAHRIWITDEALMTVFVLQGACADGTGTCP
jgi:hypothetical protein